MAMASNAEIERPPKGPLRRAARALMRALRGRRRVRRRGLPLASLSFAFANGAPADEEEEEARPSGTVGGRLELHAPSPSFCCTRRSAFPLAITHHQLPNSTSSSHAEQQATGQQRLLAIGSRHWGSGAWWDTRSMLKIKIYDFGVYASPAELQAATLAAASAEGTGTLSRASARHSTATHPLRSLLPCGRDALAHLVQAPTQMLPSNGVGHVSGSIDATLLLHAARDLPVEQLALEMQNVLERRNVKAGASKDDAALADLLRCLSSLPDELLTPSRDHVKRGGVIAFHRTCGGASAADGSAADGSQAASGDGPDACSIQVSAGAKSLGSVRSNSLSTALFDLYLGDDPVSAKAKAAAAKSLQRMASDPRALYIRSEDKGRLTCLSSDPSACYVELH